MTPARFETLMRTYFHADMPAPRDATPLEALGFDGDDMIDILVAIERADRRKIVDDEAVQLATYGDLKRLATADQVLTAAPPPAAPQSKQVPA